jgi:hypothetical protein
MTQISFILLILFVFKLPMAFAQNPTYEISGNTKTNKFAIESELLLFNAKTNDEIEQILLNTGLFSEVKVTQINFQLLFLKNGPLYQF